MKIETLAVHTGREIEPATGAVTPSITLATTFERDADGSLSRPNVYTRIDNPNRNALERALVMLEGGDEAAAFASGMAATSAVLQALSPGDHLIVGDDTYFGTRNVLKSVYARWGLEMEFVDPVDAGNFARAMRPNTKMIWIETPSNPSLKITDIAKAAEIAHSAGALLAVDNTWATPLLQQPFAHGADLVMHSTTKYIGGHSDVLGGAIITRNQPELMQRIRQYQMLGGAVPAPFDCWLLLRSIPTLPYRMRAHCENAAQVASFLHQHPKVERVNFPGLPSHPNHEVAARQMPKGFGGMLSVQVKGAAAEALAVAAKVKVFTRATSLGGVESLIEHRASIEGPGTPTPANLLRVSVGLEHPDDLIADLEQALS